MSRPKRQVPDPYRVLTFLASGIVRRGLGLGLGARRAIGELAFFVGGFRGRGRGDELLLFFFFLLPSPFGV